MLSRERTPIRRTSARLGATVSAVLLGGVACLGAAAPANAADMDDYSAPYSSAQVLSIDVDSVSTPGDITYESKFFNAATNRAKGGPLVGYTGPGGRHFVTTGLVYPKTDVYSSSVRIHAPVVATTGSPSYPTSAAQLSAECRWDGKATTQPTASVSVVSPVPGFVPKTPAPGYTVYRGGAGNEASYDLKVVFNEQSILPNGQLQVIAEHVYFDVPNIAGSSAVKGDVKLGILSCGPAADNDATPTK